MKKARLLLIAWTVACLSALTLAADWPMSACNPNRTYRTEEDNSGLASTISSHGGILQTWHKTHKDIKGQDFCFPFMYQNPHNTISSMTFSDGRVRMQQSSLPLQFSARCNPLDYNRATTEIASMGKR